MRYQALLVLIVGVVLSLSGQNRYPQDYFRLPMDITPYLSGSFGEPRFTHFHAGLDIKTNQQEGIEIKAAADGYVSRIKISTYGYGKCIYIQHPNGYTTVYGHLKSLNDTIAAYVKDAHYTRRAFEIDIQPEPGKLKVKKGETVALSGNTGGSGGPHLHFEIRDELQRPINPLLFGIKVTDNIAPYIGDLMIHDLGEQRFYRESKILDLSKYSGVYRPAADTILVNSDKVGLAVHTYDKFNGSANRNGIYSMKMYVDSFLVHEYTVDRLSFSEQRYVGSQIDYRKRNLENKTFHLAFRQPGNRFSGVKESEKDGIIHLLEDYSREILIEVADYNGNRSRVRFFIRTDKKKDFFDPKKIYFSKLMIPNKDNYFSSEDIKVTVPNGALFDSLFFNYGVSANDRENVFSKVHFLHDDHVPLFRSIQIAIKTEGIPAKLSKKAVVMRRDWENDFHSEGGRMEGQYIITRSKYFGEFYVQLDTVPPRVRAINIYEGKNMRNERQIRMRITDNLSGIEDYDAYIDGEWILMDYDYKTNRLVHDLKNDLPSGEHLFKLVVSDERNNKTIFTTSFKN